MKMIRLFFLLISLSFVAQAWAGPVNINTADAQALTELNGIGAAKAQAIIEYREKHGAFTDVEQLAEVDGIGTKTLEKLKPELIVK